MQVIKVRRVGNSNVITLPRSLEEAGYTPGSEIVLDGPVDGTIVLRPAKGLTDIREIARVVIKKHAKALALLEAYDRGEGQMAPRAPERG